jgi:arsenate reductase
VCRKCRTKSNGEAFIRKYAPNANYEEISAGTRHASQINPLAVQVMKEVGIDISNQKSKEMTEDMIRNATKIINLFLALEI